jgi:uncharacterized protein (DUF433 family)
MYRIPEEGFLMPKPIMQDLEIQAGKPVLAGRRLPVSIVVGSLAGGMSYPEVMEEYSVTMDDILSCLAYATQAINSEIIYQLPEVS